VLIRVFMQLNNLPKTTTKKKKRQGRGYGSGKGGHTVGRGQKGQKSRSKVPLLFEGTKRGKSLMGRLAMLRGKGKLKSRKNKPVIVNVKYLNLLSDGAIVDIKTLSKAGIVDKKDAIKYGVKILGDGKLEKKLTVELPTSKGAKKKIEGAGGRVIQVAKVVKVRRVGKAGKEKVGKVAKEKKRIKDKATQKRKTRAKSRGLKPKKPTTKTKTNKKPATAKAQKNAKVRKKKSKLNKK